MAAYSDVVNDSYGRPIPGVAVYVLNRDGTLATLTGGQANPLATDAFGRFSFNAADAVYDLEFRYGGVTERQDSILVGNPPQYVGPSGPANSTYLTRAALKAAPVTNASYIFAPAAGSDSGLLAGTFLYQTAGAPYTDDNANVIKLDAVPLSTGALVRQDAGSFSYKAPASAVTRVFADSYKERPVTPQDLGAVADGTTPAQNAFLALSATNRPMLVPPGDYFIDNSSIRQINAYTGELTFSPGARLIFSDNTKKGLYFVGGSPKIRGVTLTTAVAPTTRQLDAPMIDLYLCTDPIISDVVVERGAGAGVLVRTCTGLRANNIVVRNTLADGMDLFNCSDFQVSNVLTDTTGDDGFAALDYADQPVSQRGILTNIIALRSNARGITINGPTNVTLDGFHVEETQGTGLMIEQDSSAGIRIPTGIKASNGTIKRAGQRVTNPSYTGNKYGIEIGQSGTVDLLNITISDCNNRGVSAVSTQGNAHLTTIGVKVETAGAQGFNIDGQTAWTFDDILAQDTAAEGIYTHDVKRLVGGLRTVVRAAKTGGNFRAIHDNSNTFMSVEKNVIVDDQATATGYVYRADGGTQGSVGTFDWLVGVFYYDNFAPYLINKGHSGPRRDGLSMPTGTPEVINATSTLDRYILGALTADKDFTLPQNGQFHGMIVSVARYDVSGTNTVRLIDPNNSNAVVTTIPAGTGAVPTKASVWWDATGTPPQFRAGGKIPL